MKCTMPFNSKHYSRVAILTGGNTCMHTRPALLHLMEKSLRYGLPSKETYNISKRKINNFPPFSVIFALYTVQSIKITKTNHISRDRPLSKHTSILHRSGINLCTVMEGWRDPINKPHNCITSKTNWIILATYHAMQRSTALFPHLYRCIHCLCYHHTSTSSSFS